LEIKKLVLHNESCKRDYNNIECDCPSIFKTNIIEYLGLHTDDCLKCNVRHIEKITINSRTFFYVFKNLKNFLSNKLKHMVYYDLIQSIVTYGNAF